MSWEELPTPTTLADRVVQAVRRRRRAAGIGVLLIVAVAVVAAALVAGSGRRAPFVPPRGERAAVYLAAVADAGAVDQVFLADAALTAADRRQLRDALGARVHFAGLPAGPTRTGRAVLVFGRLRIRGRTATLPRTTLCGPMCLEGKTLVLTREHGAWRVTGSTGPEWMS